jgi:hypothetical protein
LDIDRFFVIYVALRRGVYDQSLIAVPHIKHS